MLTHGYCVEFELISVVNVVVTCVIAAINNAGHLMRFSALLLAMTSANELSHFPC